MFKKILFFLLIPAICFAQAHPRITSPGQHPLRHRAERLKSSCTDAEVLGGTSSGTGVECQAASAGAGDIEQVGDCTTGVCFTGGAGSVMTFGGATGVVVAGTTNTFNVAGDFVTTDIFQAISTGVTVINKDFDSTGDVTFNTGGIRPMFFSDYSEDCIGINQSDCSLHTFAVTGHLGITTTADENDAHSIELIADAAGFGDFKAIDIDYITGTLGAGEDAEAILVNIDESASTGGDMHGIVVLSTDVGSATIRGLEAGVNVAPIFHESGTFGDWDRCEIDTGSFTDCLTAVNNTGTDVQMWVSNGDLVYLGLNDENFEEIEWIFDTVASGPGIKPTFEFSTASGFTTFSPIDGTNGARNNGVMAWDADDLSGWATRSVDGDTAFWVRITRTANNVTGPTEDLVQVASPTNYSWDKDGLITAQGLIVDMFEAVTTGVTVKNTDLTVVGDLSVDLATVTGALATSSMQVTPLVNCDTIDTDVAGIFSCGTDSGAGGGAPVGATYVTLSTDGDLTDERVLTAGTNISSVDAGAGSTITLNVDDSFIVNDADDDMNGVLTANGLTLAQDENITLGAQTLDHDGTDFVFNDDINTNLAKVTGVLASVSHQNTALASCSTLQTNASGIFSCKTSGVISGLRKTLKFTLIDPNAAFDLDTQFGVWTNTDASLTVTKLSVELDATGNEIAGDLKWADDFATFANATVINDFDTTSGVRVDTSITAGSVPAGKLIYIQFDSDPAGAITNASFAVEYNYD